MFSYFSVLFSALKFLKKHDAPIFWGFAVGLFAVLLLLVIYPIRNSAVFAFLLILFWCSVFIAGARNRAQGVDPSHPLLRSKKQRNSVSIRDYFSQLTWVEICDYIFYVAVSAAAILNALWRDEKLSWIATVWFVVCMIAIFVDYKKSREQK